MPETIKSAISTPEGLLNVRFEKLPISDDFLYAVYCIYKGTPLCFHMMYDERESLEFRVIDTRNCPADLRQLSYLFSTSIEHFHA